MKIPICEIIVGKRRREEMGDIQGLADSIQKFGLLHPVVVDEQKVLVAGARRLEACKLLGRNEIEVTFLGELSEQQLREIELEENLRRKDLSDIELSKNMVELAEIKAEELRKQTGKLNQSESDQKVSHRPTKPDSLKKIAETMRVPKTTLIEAKQHVQAVKDFPELGPQPKVRAIEAAKQLRQLPEEEQRRKLAEIDKQIDRKYDIRKSFNEAISKATCLIIDQERLNFWTMDSDISDINCKIRDIDWAITNLNQLKQYLQSMLKGPRLVGGGKA